jgi:hypothetical protein
MTRDGTPRPVPRHPLLRWAAAQAEFEGNNVEEPDERYLPEKRVIGFRVVNPMGLLIGLFGLTAAAMIASASAPICAARFDLVGYFRRPSRGSLTAAVMSTTTTTPMNATNDDDVGGRQFGGTKIDAKCGGTTRLQMTIQWSLVGIKMHFLLSKYKL